MSTFTNAITFSMIASASAQQEFEVVSSNSRLECEDDLFLFVDGEQQWCLTAEFCISAGGEPQTDTGLCVYINQTCPADTYIWNTAEGYECITAQQCDARHSFIEGNECIRPSCGPTSFLCLGEGCPTQCPQIEMCNEHNGIVNWFTRECEISDVTCPVGKYVFKGEPWSCLDADECETRHGIARGSVCQHLPPNPCPAHRPFFYLPDPVGTGQCMTGVECRSAVAGVINFDNKYCEACPVGTGDRVFYSEGEKNWCLSRAECGYTITDGKVAGDYCVADCPSDKPYLYKESEEIQVPECLSAQECDEVGEVRDGKCVDNNALQEIVDSLQNAVSSVGDRIKKAMKKLRNRFRKFGRN